MVAALLRVLVIDLGAVLAELEGLLGGGVVESLLEGRVDVDGRILRGLRGGGAGGKAAAASDSVGAVLVLALLDALGVDLLVLDAGLATGLALLLLVVEDDHDLTAGGRVGGGKRADDLLQLLLGGGSDAKLDIGHY